ncbi:hypothetical protein Tco_0157713 [Tanacetum coccineum]
MISMNITSPPPSLEQTNFVLEDRGTNLSDSSIDVLQDLCALAWDSLGCLGWIVMALIEPWMWVEHCGFSAWLRGLLLKERFGFEPLDWNWLGVTKIVLLGFEGIPLTSCFIDLTEVVLEQDELPSSIGLDFRARLDSGAEVEHPEPGFELQGAKMIEVVDGVVACRGCFGQKGGDVAQFGAKEGKIFVVAAEWREDGYCNRGNLSGAYIVGYTFHYQDLEWYDALKDSWKSWDDFEITNGDRNEWEYKNEHEDDERYELCGNETHEFPVCNIRRFEMIKYSFGQDKEYVAIKENKYEDLTSTSENACQTYQEIFLMMEKGWMVTRME